MLFRADHRERISMPMLTASKSGYISLCSFEISSTGSAAYPSLPRLQFVDQVTLLAVSPGIVPSEALYDFS
jgi:hypothetical protein